ncbi:MAG: DoxX family protein [Gemmatimonadaceae bacterium]
MMRILARARCWASLPLRTAIGIGCIHHGWHNIILADERHAFLWMLQAIGVARPHPLLWVISLVSMVGGLALLAGAFVRVVSIALAANVPGILIVVHWPSGFDYLKLTAVTPLGPQYGMPGFEVSVLYLAALLSLVLAGAGPYSWDAWRRRRASGDAR